MNNTYHDHAAGKKAVEHIRSPFQIRSADRSGSSEDNDRCAASVLAFERDLDSSESIPSEHSSIYDAARASSGSDTGDQTYYDSLSRQNTAEEQHDLSLVFSDQDILNVTSSHSRWPVNTLATIVERRSTSTLRHSRSMSCLYESFSGEALQLSRPSRLDLNTSILKTSQRRKAFSFNDAESRPEVSNFLGNNLSPVSPVQPTYPPPIRSPTPPGLPSFGTEEALFCASRFAIQSPTLGSSSSGTGDGRRNSYDGSVAGSYSEAFRRLFGFTSPLDPRPARLPIHAIGRAADGTAVRGRFPIRQSGHGIDLSRSLDSHPFHRRTLPVAQPQVDRRHSTGNSRKSGRQSSHSEVRTSQGSEPVLAPNFPSTLQRALSATMRRTDARTPVKALPSLPSSQDTNSQSARPHETQSVHISSPVEDTSRPQHAATDGNLSVPYQLAPQPSSAEALPGNGSPETDAGDEHNIAAWSETMRMYIFALCCCSAEDDDPDGLQLSNQHSSSVTTRNESVTVSEDVTSPIYGVALSRRSTTRESSDGQRRSRASRPWRPAYGFSPRATDVTMSPVG